jgi:hypothetical protein
VGETLNPGASNGIRVGMQVTSQPRKRHESLDVNLLTPKMNQLTLMVGGERRASLLGVEAIMEEFKKRGGGDVKFFWVLGRGRRGVAGIWIQTEAAKARLNQPGIISSRLVKSLQVKLRIRDCRKFETHRTLSVTFSKSRKTSINNRNVSGKSN